jgi:glycolate dehydrogenase FAD-linked subunit
MFEYPEYELEEVYADLSGILAKEAVSKSIFERINNSLDPYTGATDITPDEVPYAVVRPSSTEEVSKVMTYANSKKIPVYIRGSGTSLHGAAKFHRKGIVLNVSRLINLEIRKDNQYFECGAGMRCIDVKQQLAKEGYFLPMAPGSIRVASMGGLISCNTTAHAIDSSLGKPRDYVIGLDVVLPTGEIMHVGTKSHRRIAGTDLTQYFVGGDGILGVITNIRMRLMPMFKSAYGVAFFDDLIPLTRSVQRIYQENAPLPLFLELLDKRCAELTFEIQGLPKPPGPLIMFHAMGVNEEDATYKINRIVEVVKKEKPIQAKRIEDITEWNKVWLARESALPFVIQAGKGAFAFSEVVSTVSGLVDCMRDVMHMGKGLPTLEEFGDPYIFGHIGALTFHPCFIVPATWPAEKKAKAVAEMFSREAELNLKYETTGGEWGQFVKRSPFFIKRYGEKAYQLVRSVKKVFDPNNILNPNILPEE